ncbi:MAG: hypothetical protein OEQ39_06410 [Gammaproteobacteria bacterium]|nr:hypothetical protein [Gammaproteobacteria bacterium]MDH3464361.1 hypothetical protein [Gammaproteobacteria bacterium]
MSEAISRSRLREETNYQIWNEFIERTYPIVRQLPRPSIPKDSQRSVVLVEPRKHPHLEYVLRNAMYFLGPEWGLEIFTGPDNFSYIKELTRSWGYVGIEKLDTNDLSTRDYNSLKKQYTFWEQIRTGHILWMEPDSIFRRTGIDEFMHLDYIGAPWGKQFAVSPACRVGNGGLSLRRRSAMLRIAAVANPHHSLFEPEDIFFCVNMSLCNAKEPGTFKLGTYEQAKRFAVEGVYDPNPLGLHKLWKYLPTEQVRQLLSTIEY